MTNHTVLIMRVFLHDQVGILIDTRLFYKKTLFSWASIFLTFPEIEAEIFLTFAGINWLKRVTLYLETAFCYLQCAALFFHYFVIQCLIFLIHDCQRKVSIFVWVLAKSELMSIFWHVKKMNCGTWALWFY